MYIPRKKKRKNNETHTGRISQNGVCVYRRKEEDVFQEIYTAAHTLVLYTALFFRYIRVGDRYIAYGTIEKRAIDQLVRVMLTAELLFAAAGLCSSTKRRV
jgi:hypothetical protein